MLNFLSELIFFHVGIIILSSKNNLLVKYKINQTCLIAQLKECNQILFNENLLFIEYNKNYLL